MTLIYSKPLDSLPTTLEPSFSVIPIKNIAVIGSRKLPQKYSIKVSQIVDYLLQKQYHIASGGAKGADDFVLSHLLHRERILTPVKKSPKLRESQ